MTETTKYRIGNRQETYELSDRYLDWKLQVYAGWLEFHDKFCLLGRDSRPSTIALVGPDGNERVTLVIHGWIIKDAFPMSVYRDHRADDWHNFLIVSVVGGDREQFIIPMCPME